MNPQIRPHSLIVLTLFLLCALLVLSNPVAAPAAEPSHNLWVLLVTVLHPPDPSCALDDAPLEAAIREMTEAVEAFAWLANLKPNLITLSDDSVKGLECKKKNPGASKYPTENETLKEDMYKKAKQQAGAVEAFPNATGPDTPIRHEEDSPPITRMPTKQNVRAAMKRLTDNARSGDTILVYLSGHASMKGNNDVALLPTKTSSPFNKNSDYISLSQDIVAAIGNTNNTSNIASYVFIDACREEKDSLSNGRRDTSVYDHTLFSQTLDGKKAHLFFSSEPKQVSHVNPQLKMGFFTQFLSKGLKGAADEGDGQLSAQELVNYINRQLSETPRDTDENLLQRSGSLSLDKASHSGDRLEKVYLYKRPIWEGHTPITLLMDVVILTDEWDGAGIFQRKIRDARRTLSELITRALTTHYKIRGVPRLHVRLLEQTHSEKIREHRQDINRLLTSLIKVKPLQSTNSELTLNTLPAEDSNTTKLIKILEKFSPNPQNPPFFLFALPARVGKEVVTTRADFASIEWVLIHLAPSKAPEVVFSWTSGKQEQKHFFGIDDLINPQSKINTVGIDSYLGDLFYGIRSHIQELKPLPRLVPWCTSVGATQSADAPISPLTHQPEKTNILEEEKESEFGLTAHAISEEMKYIPGDWHVETMKPEYLSGACDKVKISPNPLQKTQRLQLDWQNQICPNHLKIDSNPEPLLIVNATLTPPLRKDKDWESELQTFINSRPLHELGGVKIPETMIRWRSDLSLTIVEDKMREGLGRALGHNISEAWSALAPKDTEINNQNVENNNYPNDQKKACIQE